MLGWVSHLDAFNLLPLSCHSAVVSAAVDSQRWHRTDTDALQELRCCAWLALFPGSCRALPSRRCEVSNAETTTTKLGLAERSGG